jgi:hypothetical protein
MFSVSRVAMHIDCCFDRKVGHTEMICGEGVNVFVTVATAFMVPDAMVSFFETSKSSWRFTEDRCGLVTILPIDKASAVQSLKPNRQLCGCFLMPIACIARNLGTSVESCPPRSLFSMLPAKACASKEAS